MRRVTRSVPRAYVCHELLGVPQFPGFEDPCAGLDLGGACPWGADPAFGEVDEGTDIEPRTLEGGAEPGGAGGARLVWDIPVHLLGARGVEWVRAAAMAHTVPCVGYVIQQAEKPGALDVSRARAALQHWKAQDPGHDAYVISERGSRSESDSSCAGGDVNRLLGVLKGLGPDERLLVGDERLAAADFIGPATAGCKLTLMGDTAAIAPGSAIEALSRGSSCLLHEATDMWLPGSRGPSEAETAALVQSRGHSTPSVAGDFARRVGARALVLTHFSQKHQPSDADAMALFRDAAAAASGLPRECVHCARDFDSLKISSVGVSITEP